MGRARLPLSRAAIVGGLLLVVAGWPLLRLALALVARPAAIVEVFGPLERASAGNTLLLALGTTAFALALGVPLGFALARAPLRHPARWRALATLPYVIPPYVTAIAWMALLNPSTGWLNAPLRALGLPSLDIYGIPGMVWVMGLEHAPIVWLATADALARSDPALEEQARVSGASPREVLLRVTLPLAGPAIVNAAALVLASSAAAFGVPYLLASGSPSPDYVLSTRIAQNLQLAPAIGQPRAIALSGALLLLSIGLPALLAAPLARRRFVTIGGKGARRAPSTAGWAVPALAAYVGVGALVPLAALGALSLTAQVGGGWGLGNTSLAAYGAIFGRGADLAAIGRSAALAGATATIATVLALLVAWSAVRTTEPGRTALAWGARLPYAVPGTVLAFGMLLAWSQEVRIPLGGGASVVFGLNDTVWLLLLAYTVKFLALPVGTLEGALRGLDPALEEAARTAGASAWRTFAAITGPLLRPALIASWFLAFVSAFTEVTMSVLLAGPQTRVIGVVLFDRQTYGDPPGAAALAVIVAAVAVAGQLAAARLTEGERRAMDGGRERR